MELNDILPFINRPLTAIEVAQLIGRDSIQTMAILDFLCAQGKLEKTKRKVGISPIYFTPDQKEQALERLFSYLNENEKQLLEKIKNNKFILLSDLKIEERLLLQNLSDFIVIKKIRNQTGEERDAVFYYTYANEQQKVEAQNKTSENKETNENKKAIEKPKISKKTKINENVEEIAQKLEMQIERKLDENTYIATYGKAKIKVLFAIENKITLKRLEELNAMAEHANLACILVSNDSKFDIYGRCYIVNLNYEQNR